MVFDDTEFSPNPIEEARRRLAGSYIDLTSSNPTRQGLLFPPDILERAAGGYWASRRYDPHPRGLLPAREAIAAYYRERSPAWAVDPEAIFLTASTSEAYSLLFSLLAAPGDNLLGPNVTYPLFQYLAELHHIELRTYDLDPERGWQIDEDSLLAAADSRTRGVLLVSPHNPTGAIIRRPSAALARLGLPLICDEVFAPFTIGADSAPPLSALHPGQPVFLLNGISKLLALPDLKLGWIALNQPALAAYADRLELINDTFLSGNTLVQSMLPALLGEGRPFVAEMVARVRDNVELALEALAGVGNLRLERPDGGYYLFPQVLGCDDDEQLVIDLLGRGVLVHPGFFYDYGDQCRIMLSCLTEPAAFRAGLARLGAALADLP
ncbi:MAG TPA: pyridoxal phosphate-dependent aminotransferase [Herpetosiphonaceae bacterium]